MSQTILITIERHIIDQQRLHPNATGAFSHLLRDIALSAKIIARETTRAGLVNIIGSADTTNIHGEQQQKLDVFADQTIFQMCDHTGRLCVMASEEHDDIVPIPENYPRGNYVLVYDPLDGSSNIDVNGVLGTVFAIHRKVTPGEQGTLEDVLQPGYKLVAAGYVIYGPSTMLVYTAGSGVYGFTLDPSVGEFILSHDNIRFPEKPKYFSINQGSEKYWTSGVRRYVKWLQGIYGEGSEPIEGRYVGALVADFHRNLLQGGIFIYPATTKTPKNWKGKLRLNYECSPLAFIAQQAGGYASDGTGPILNIQPTDLHQRTPFFVGSTALVKRAEAFIRDYDQEWLRQYEPTRIMLPDPEPIKA